MVDIEDFIPEPAAVGLGAERPEVAAFSEPALPCA